jgi:putative hemolysin
MESTLFDIDQRTYPGDVQSIPAAAITSGPYMLDFARSAADLLPIFRLRYRVFNEELGEGFAQSQIDQMDRDAYDEQFHHLYIRDLRSGDIIGTYRLQTRAMADNGSGFYSDGIFDLSSIPEEVLAESVEIGRACIHKHHRSVQVLHMLWKGIGTYMTHNRKEFLFGCCSLTSQDSREGWDVYAKLKEAGQMSGDFRVEPRSGFSCMSSPVTPGDPSSARIPRLMRTYLSFGAKICSTPAIDRNFRTIDFLTIFGLSSMPENVLAFYNVRR